MYLIHPPDGVPVSTVPQVLRLANKSQQIAALTVNYFRVANSETFVKTQLKKRSIKPGETKILDTTDRLLERVTKFENFSDKISATPISNINDFRILQKLIRDPDGVFTRRLVVAVT